MQMMEFCLKMVVYQGILMIATNPLVEYNICFILQIQKPITIKNMIMIRAGNQS